MKVLEDYPVDLVLVRADFIPIDLQLPPKVIKCVKIKGAVRWKAFMPMAEPIPQEAVDAVVGEMEPGDEASVEVWRDVRADDPIGRWILQRVA